MRALASARALPAVLLLPRARALPGRRGAHATAAPARAMLEQAVTAEVERKRQDPRLQQAREPQQPGGSNGSSAEASAEAPLVKPGDDDRTRFQLHWSVDTWCAGLLLRR